ncbi:MAG TPA: 2Fe-2S iron-sulfur cluster-binding protein, partial [bacterium]|nr:2Fe-2S iron-sulfur cluster-binding protein [bacterium]
MFVIIDGKKIEFSSVCTIMELAEKNGIEIPSLCYDKRFPHYTSCFVCMVKDLRTGRFLPSCSANVVDGMEISTKDEEVIKYRKLALDLLLSEHDADCFSPCKTSCPAGIDVRDYIILAKNSSDLDGFIRIREKNPFVSVVGRVCPAFCEKDCS